MLRSGSVLSGRYRLDQRVATGGMGDVWRATDLVLGREVAVKVLLPALVTDQSFIARFRAEARNLAALHHPGIVQVYDCGEDESGDGGRADYLVMEYVAGEPLSRRIGKRGVLSVAESMSVVAQAADALHAAHESGIIHRDVKPSNLLIEQDGTVVLVDFGVARSTAATSITSTNSVPGTVLYMAPEQASGRPVSPATDVYALGAVAYCCLTGNPPFVGDYPLEVAVRHVNDAPPALPDDLPAPVRALVSRALEKAPEDRYPSAAAMADAARAAASHSSASGLVVRGAAPVGLAGAAEGADALVGAARAGDGRTTMHDLPAVPAPVGPARRPRSRATAVAGGVAAVVLAIGGLAAALAAGQGDDGQPHSNTPSTTATTGVPAGEPTGPRQADYQPSADASDEPGGPVEPTTKPIRRSPTPTGEPATSAPATTEPTEPPATEPVPTPDGPTPTGGSEPTTAPS